MIATPAHADAQLFEYIKELHVRLTVAEKLLEQMVNKDGKVTLVMNPEDWQASYGHVEGDNVYDSKS